MRWTRTRNGTGYRAGHDGIGEKRRKEGRTNGRVCRVGRKEERGVSRRGNGTG